MHDEKDKLVSSLFQNICVLDPNLKSVCDEFSELCRTDPTLYEQLKKQVMSMMFIRQMSEGNVIIVVLVKYVVYLNRKQFNRKKKIDFNLIQVYLMYENRS